MSSVFLVWAEDGDYSDYRAYPIAAFRTKEEAESAIAVNSERLRVFKAWECGNGPGYCSKWRWRSDDDAERWGRWYALPEHCKCPGKPPEPWFPSGSRYSMNAEFSVMEVPAQGWPE